MIITATDNSTSGPQTNNIGDQEKQAKILRLKKACLQFEALFIQYLLKSMRSTTNESKLLGDGLGSDIFKQLFDEGLAEKMAESSPLGLSNMLYKSFDDSEPSSLAEQTSFIPARTFHYKPNILTPEIVQSRVAGRVKLDRFNPIINEAANANDVDPRLVKAVIIQESGGNPKAISAKGAKGLMQLMDTTARMLGVTDPFDVRQNIFGGVKYLGKLLKKFNGDIKKALAAYNAGPRAVDKYDGIPPYEETRKYVSNIMGMLEGNLILKSPDKIMDDKL